MTDQAQCPSFVEAVARFREFLRGQEWPDTILWLAADDVVRDPGKPFVVERRGTPP
jgi:hypothetical protein